MKRSNSNTIILIGTSGWHYTHWFGIFYPPEIKGYYELKFHSQHFRTVENNSSFYRIAGESTYKTWDKMTPEYYKFSIKLNKFITHLHKLELTDEVKEKIFQIITSTQILGNKLGAMLIQLPPSLKFDLETLELFLDFLSGEIKKHPHRFDLAIEFRNKHWLNIDVYEILKKYNVALVSSQSSRYPETRQITANIAYIRLHGPGKLFASPYTDEQLKEWSKYIKKISRQVNTVYVYFNNDFHGYALANAYTMMDLVSQIKKKKII